MKKESNLGYTWVSATDAVWAALCYRRDIVRFYCMWKSAGLYVPEEHRK